MSEEEKAQPEKEPGRVERKRARIRVALLAAARRVLTTRGYRDATITEIVQLADVAVGTFYLHFRDKEDLFTAFVQEEMDAMFEHIRRAINGQPPEQVFAPLIRAILAQAYQQRELFLFACTEATFAHAIMQSAQIYLTNALLPALQQAQRQVPATNSLLQAHLITGMVVQAISWWFEHDEPEPDAMAAAIFSLLEQSLPPSLLDANNSRPSP